MYGTKATPETCCSWKTLLFYLLMCIAESLEASSECPGAGNLFKFLLEVEQAFNPITSREAEAG